MSTDPKKRRKFNALFVHSDLDEYGMSANTFRVLTHLARRADENDEAWPSVSSMAETCWLSRQTVVNSIRELEGFNMIQARRKFGVGTMYTLQEQSEWKKPTARPKKEKRTSAPNGLVPEIDQSISDTAPVPQIDCHQSKVDTQRISKEGNPLKDNTVAGPSDPVPTLPPPPVVPSQESRPPGGSLAPPRRDEPAVFRQNAGGNSSKIPFKSSQTPIQLKAYAIAGRLRFRHWDNCKVFFAKHTARAYAEKALRDGHDEQIILRNYEIALRYCHGDTTDEIGRGERLQHERVSPALTVWLARECLSGDPRTVEERWKAVIARLTPDRRKVIEEEARIRQEIEAEAPAINAWFANKHGRDATSGQPPMPEVEPQRITA